jgi:molecular chaperone GrpE (heat shock protein)
MTMKSYIDTVVKGPNNNTEYKAARERINDGFFPLQKKFNDFRLRLSKEVETISNYGIGKTFKYEENCPICKQF